MLWPGSWTSLYYAEARARGWRLGGRSDLSRVGSPSTASAELGPDGQGRSTDAGRRDRVGNGRRLWWICQCLFCFRVNSCQLLLLLGDLGVETGDRQVGNFQSLLVEMSTVQHRANSCSEL